MSNTLEAAKKIYEAFETKNSKALPNLVHPDYVGIMPGMEIKGIEACIKCVELCPFENHSENVSYIVDGDKVVRLWDMVATAPVQFKVRMMELLHVKDGKMFYSETVFDSRSFPKVAMALCEQQSKN